MRFMFAMVALTSLITLALLAASKDSRRTLNTVFSFGFSWVGVRQSNYTGYTDVTSAGATSSSGDAAEAAVVTGAAEAAGSAISVILSRVYTGIYVSAFTLPPIDVKEPDEISTKHLGPSLIHARLTLRSDTRSAACNKDSDDISSTILWIFASPTASGGVVLLGVEEAASVLANLRHVPLDIAREGR